MLFLVDTKSPGLNCELLQTMAGDKQCEVKLDEVRVGREYVLSDLDQGWHVLEKVMAEAAVANCAQMVGAAQRALDLTTAYVKERIQFNKPIGAFQAIQHHCANMLSYLETSRLITYKAAWMLSQNIPCTGEVAMAKAWVNQACTALTALAHQAHGGAGVIAEYDLPLYSRRMKQWEVMFGDTSFFLEKLATEMGLP